jgi:hypothetical protein
VVIVVTISNGGMPHADESAALSCWACAFHQLGQAPRRVVQRKRAMLVFTPWRSPLRMASLLSPEDLNQLQATGAVKQSC